MRPVLTAHRSPIWETRKPRYFGETIPQLVLQTGVIMRTKSSMSTFESATLFVDAPPGRIREWVNPMAVSRDGVCVGIFCDDTIASLFPLSTSKQ